MTTPNYFLDELVHIVPYNRKWPELFLEEKKKLTDLFQETIFIEHIGSTAVAGLSAKPIIDIIIGFKDYSATSSWIAKVESLGYHFFGEAGIPERLYFTKREKLVLI